MYTPANSTIIYQIISYYALPVLFQSHLERGLIRVRKDWWYFSTGQFFMLDFRNLNPIENAVKDYQLQNSGNCWIFGFALLQYLR